MVEVMAAVAPHVELRGISKRYGGVRAVEDVDLVIKRGSVHALVGANGAGKSTLGKIISGAVVPDDGTLEVRGQEVRLRSPRDALRQGLARISQEIAVVPTRSVLDNVFLSRMPRRGAGRIDTGAMRRDFASLTARTGFSLPERSLVGNLNLAQQQQVEILRALVGDAELIVMDEPSAALTGAETAQLMAIIRTLADGGTTIVFVSHFLEDVLSVADDVTIMRDGLVVRSGPADEETIDSLVVAMLGDTAEVEFPDRPAFDLTGPPALAVRGLSRPPAFSDVSFDVWPGEILGISGLMGSGRSELLRAIFGADAHTVGTIELLGRTIKVRNTRDAVRHGIAMVPESRKLQGLHLNHSLGQNVSLPHLGRLSDLGVVRSKRERALVSTSLGDVGVHAKSAASPVWALSGGNQQRVLFAKWLAMGPKVLLVDEPTRGVDVGGKRAIYELLVELSAAGAAVVVVSSELEEVVALSHRVLVMRSGRVAAELEGTAITESALLRAGFGQESEVGIS